MDSNGLAKLWKLKIVRYLTGLVAFILIVLFFNDVIMPWYVRLGQEYELPDVVSMPVEQARDSLQKAGFQLVVKDSVYDVNFAPGTITEQQPAAYSKVKKGRHVYVTVSIGEKPIIMPNLFFKSPREAELILKAHRLQLGNLYYEYSDLALQDVVIGQSFPQGQKVKPGTKIDLTISLGPMPKQKVVPDLVGKSLDAAKTQLQLLGVKTIQVEYEYKEDILPETVIAQSVKKGTPIDQVQSIKLTVSQLPAKEE
jgi:serine/threonine-protein kinase